MFIDNIIEGNKIIIEPARDILNSGGKLNKKAFMNKKIAKTIELEEKSISKMIK